MRKRKGRARSRLRKQIARLSFDQKRALKYLRRVSQDVLCEFRCYRYTFECEDSPTLQHLQLLLNHYRELGIPIPSEIRAIIAKINARYNQIHLDQYSHFLIGLIETMFDISKKLEFVDRVDSGSKQVAVHTS